MVLACRAQLVVRPAAITATEHEQCEAWRQPCQLLITGTVVGVMTCFIYSSLLQYEMSG